MLGRRNGRFHATAKAGRPIHVQGLMQATTTWRRLKQCLPDLVPRSKDNEPGPPVGSTASPPGRVVPRPDGEDQAQGLHHDKECSSSPCKGLDEGNLNGNMGTHQAALPVDDG